MNVYSTEDTAADSTQDQNTKETFVAETSSIERAESSSSAAPEKDSDLVCSTVNGNSSVTKHQEAEMIPESSSDAQEKTETPVVSSMEEEPSSASSVEPSTQPLPSEEVHLDGSR